MTVIHKASGKKPCSTCLHAHHGKCNVYINDVTGEDAHCTDARRHCNGVHWEARPDKAETYTPLWANEAKTYRD